MEQQQSASKSFFNVIVVNAIYKDQSLIQKKWLEKVQHIESAQRCTYGPSVGPLYITVVSAHRVQNKAFQFANCKLFLENCEPTLPLF